jgi:hypothetical protein
MSQSLNTKYQVALAKNPLLTKAITAAMLAVLNEVIASTAAKEFKISMVLNTKIKHPFSWKLPLFALFSAGVSAPVTHYGYKWLNSLFKAPLSTRQKILQIFTSMATLTPLMGTLFVAFVSLVNMKPQLQSFSKEEMKRAWTHVKTALHKSLLPVLKSSWITGPIVISICQKFLQPELWVLFNQLCYFVLGTCQNTLLKIRTKKQYEYLKKREELKDEVDKVVIKGDEEVSLVLKESSPDAAN